MILRRVLDRPQYRTLFGAVADRHRFGQGMEAIAKRDVDLFVDVQPLGGDADLSGVEECAEEQLLGDLFDVDVGHDDRRVVAAQLQRDPLKVSRRRLHDLLAGRRGSGEGDLGKPGVGGHQRAELVSTTDDVQNACGENIAQQFAELQRAQRREWRGLQHQGVARQQRRRDFPYRQQERKVPGHDRADHAQGFVVDFHPLGFAVFDDVYGQFEVRCSADPRGGLLNLPLGAGVRPPLLLHEQAREIIGMRLDQVGCLDQAAPTLGDRRRSPSRIGCFGGVDRSVEIGGACGRRIGKGFAVGWIDDLDRPIDGRGGPADGHGEICIEIHLRDPPGIWPINGQRDYR